MIESFGFIVVGRIIVKDPHRLGRRTKGAIYRLGYLPLSTRFKTVRGEDSPKRTISRARRWDVSHPIAEVN